MSFFKSKRVSNNFFISLFSEAHIVLKECKVKNITKKPNTYFTSNLMKGRNKYFIVLFSS